MVSFVHSSAISLAYPKASIKLSTKGLPMTMTVFLSHDISGKHQISDSIATVIFWETVTISDDKNPLGLILAYFLPFDLVIAIEQLPRWMYFVVMFLLSAAVKTQVAGYSHRIAP